MGHLFGKCQSEAEIHTMGAQEIIGMSVLVSTIERVSSSRSSSQVLSDPWTAASNGPVTIQNGDAVSEETFHGKSSPCERRSTTTSHSKCHSEEVLQEKSADIENKDAPSDITGAPSVINDEKSFVHDSASSSADTKEVSPKENGTSKFAELPKEMAEAIFSHLPLRDVAIMRCVNKSCKLILGRPTFPEERKKVRGKDTEGNFSPHIFSTDDKGDLHWYSFDSKQRKFDQVPSLNFQKDILPSPDPELFKDHLMAHAEGLICINTGKSPGPDRLVVCNPVTQEAKVLPPLGHPRQPVLIHMRTDGEDHYKVVVAGSATAGTGDLSLITEEYSSRTSLWTRSEHSDLPCPQFGLNEYQNAAYYRYRNKEYLLCVVILSTGARGILFYDLEIQRWIQDDNMKPQIPVIVRDETTVAHLATTQILNCGHNVFVYSEQELGKDVFICIHKLFLTPSGATWREIVQRKRPSGRGLLVYPEYICAPISNYELCVFNTIEHSMEIIDVNNPSEIVPFGTKPRFIGNPFHTLNPIGFMFQPTFQRKVCPGSNTCSALCSECRVKKTDNTVRAPL